jgi:hypothetical protein
MEFPPISAEARFDEPAKPRKLSIWKGTAAPADARKLALVAEKLAVDEGQYQADAGEGQFGSGLDGGGVKNRSFDPLSMKLW